MRLSALASEAEAAIQKTTHQGANDVSEQTANQS